MTFIFCLLLGCNKSDPLVGKWTTQIDCGSAEMELTKDHLLNFGENNGAWQRTEDGKVLLTMKSGAYSAKVRGPVLSFMVGDKDVIFTKN